MDADQNLYFGVLALQADFIDAMQFADACKEWGTRKDVPLAQLLVERGWLTAAQRSELEQRQRPPLCRQQESVSGGLATVTDPAPSAASTESCLGSGLETPPLVPFVSPVRSRYTLTRLHAAGGIGRVWLAHDDHLGRDVALKELRPDMAESRAHRQRFVQEARVTGQLEHPSIVPVYELTEQPGNRQPFYVMRFVQGRTFSEAAAAYHEKRRVGQAASLELAALLNAFVGVCNAVAYAHVRGVIHRDLKGQNIVLGEFGEVIVLDWGLAKVLGQAEATASTAVLEPGDAEMRTAQGQVLGTPAYLAPEQAAGRIDRIDQRTDVYGLGAILYEILTGRPPFTGSDVLELLRRVREQEPVRPRALWAEVPRALEAVCLRALAKEPEQRYASAQEMAEEVRRWLADEPVHAYRESLTARLARWARRHKTWVSGAAALLVTVALALAVGVVLVGEQKARAEANFQKAEEQRAMAEENFRLAHDAVDRYFVQVSESKLLNVPGLQPLRKELLAMAGDYHQRFVEQRGNDPHLRADLGKSYYRLAWVTSETGSKAKAIELLQKALAVFEPLIHEEPGNADHPHALATCYNTLGDLYRETKDIPRAEQAQRKALDIWQELAKNYPNDLSYQSRAAQTYLDLGRLYEEAKQWASAEQAIQDALHIWQHLVKLRRQETRYEELVAWCQYTLAKVYRETRRLSDAEQALTEALVTYRRRSSEHSVATVLLDLGNLYSASNRADQSIAAYQEAQTLCADLTRKNPLVPLYQRDLAAAHKNLGSVYLYQRNMKEAEKHFDLALTIIGNLADSYADVPEYQHLLAMSHYNFGFFYKDTSRWPNALKSFEKARAIEDQLVARYQGIPEYEKAQADVNNSIGYMHLQAGRLAEAVDALQQSRAQCYELVKKYTDVADYKNALARTLVNLGLAHRSANRSDEALRCHEEALPFLKQIVEENPTNADFRNSLAQNLGSIGNLQRAGGRPAEAVETQRQAVFHLQQIVDANPKDIQRRSDLGAAMNNLGLAQAANKELQKALDAYQEAIVQQKIAFAKAPEVVQYRRYLGNHYWNLAKVYRELNRPADAVATTLRWAELWPNDPEDQYAAAVNLAVCLPLVGKGNSTLTESEEKDRRHYADQAMDALRRAVNKGFKDAGKLRKESAFEPLQGRQDFQQLLKEVESRAKPDAGSK